jgi:signal transduction histidine kinase
MTVKNFLNLSRIEKEELELSVQNVFLKEDVVDVAIDAFARQALEKNMAIENNVPFECSLDADGLLLLMVMNNLVGNAIKYGTKGGCISISSAEAGQTVTVTVYNTGRPLTQQETEKLFKRFSRLESSPEAKKARGTGLGLFLCKTIVERHGGTIRCEPDQTGNNFIFIIPHSQADRQTESPASATTKENTYA